MKKLQTSTKETFHRAKAARTDWSVHQAHVWMIDKSWSSAEGSGSEGVALKMSPVKEQLGCVD